MPLINNLGAIIDEQHITFMSSVPSLWRLALTCSPRPAGHSLLRVHVGSAPLSAALWSEIAAWSDAEVVNCYGITETANWIGGASSREDTVADGLVGKMWGGDAGVMDDGGSIRDKGTGEIVIKSSCLMSGYYKRPDLTAAAFSDGWFRTGDQGRIDETRRIWVTGRIKDEINRGGFKVQPAEIDALLESHPSVAEACVFGIPDPMGGEAIAAAIRLENGERASPLSLQSWCSERLRRAAVPEHWFIVPEIPRTARGKVSRDVVRRMLTENTNTDTRRPKGETPKSPAIAVAATFTSDPLFPALRFAFAEAGLAFEVQSAPYHQVIQELRSSTSLLATNIDGVDAIIVRFEDFVRDAEDIEKARTIIRQIASELEVALNEHSRRTKMPTLLLILPPSPRVSNSLSHEIDAVCKGLLAQVRSLPGLTIVSPEEIGPAPSEGHYDKVADELAHIPFTEAHYAAIALLITKTVHALRAPMDEKLWRGALGDGTSLLKALRERGLRSRTLPGIPVMPATDTERSLLDLWVTVIGIDGIGVEDDYFALGGTSLMAARLFAEIARRFATQLPLTTILEAPTVRALSRRLDQRQTAPAGQLIELKPGGRRTLYFVHDGMGETLLYLNLARRMPADVSVVGIEPRRIPGVPVAHARIEDMAAFYVDEIRKKQPHGPYLFAGMCAGGVVAYEMASQLVRTGESVELVALLDANTPQATKKMGRINQHRLGRLKQALGESTVKTLTPISRAKAFAGVIWQKIAGVLIWEARKRAEKLSVHVRFGLLRQLLRRHAAWPSFVPELRAQQILNSAQARYEPPPLPISSIVLARAISGEGNDTPYSKIYADPTLGWATVAKNLTVIDVEGGHSSMLQEAFVGSLAGALMPYVKKEPANPQRGG